METMNLTLSHLAAIKAGKTRALDMQNEYVLFVSAEAHPHPDPLGS
jgi:hypothetical protein